MFLKKIVICVDNLFCRLKIFRYEMNAYLQFQMLLDLFKGIYGILRCSFFFQIWIYDSLIPGARIIWTNYACNISMLSLWHFHYISCGMNESNTLVFVEVVFNFTQEAVCSITVDDWRIRLLITKSLLWGFQYEVSTILC